MYDTQAIKTYDWRLLWTIKLLYYGRRPIHLCMLGASALIFQVKQCDVHDSGNWGLFETMAKLKDHNITPTLYRIVSFFSSDAVPTSSNFFSLYPPHPSNKHQTSFEETNISDARPNISAIENSDYRRVPAYGSHHHIN